MAEVFLTNKDKTALEGKIEAKADKAELKKISLEQLGAAAIDLSNVPIDLIKNINKHYWKRQKVELSITLATSTQEISMYEVTASGPYNTFPFYYSENIELSIDYDAQTSRVALKNPQFEQYGKGSYANYPGKYISLNSDGSEPVYYVEAVNQKASNQYVDYFTVTARQVFSRSTTLDEIELLYDENIDAYPDGLYGNYVYTYMGTPENNVLFPMQIQSGSYVGTGTHGVNNPNTLTFRFEPKVVLIYTSSGYITTIFPWAPQAVVQLSSSHVAIITSIEGNTVSWYSGQSQHNQLNASGIEYWYTAIG